MGNSVDSGSFYDNMNDQYAIEYNGISPRLTINVPLDGSDVYDVRIGVADTGDHALDSGLFVSNFSTSTFDYGGLQVQVEANPDGGVVKAAGANTATYFQGGLGNDIFQGSTAPDIYDLQAGGENVIQGNAAQLNGDTVLGFQPDDKIEVLESSFT
ncbi:choice-of-anchor L domain-containing protein, partial [Ectothiorhodospira haloalkaliphila]|uniref:choice-of-anchor L domain-containing protein n=1 Tax=Ectothiorhodospira haloalkaliphila TaxID=421628 RepID=UPI001EE92DBA|nr:choice-of-anchor L domain-containing protein [Ectothiorhodospira haloalkaliphila]